MDSVDKQVLSAALRWAQAGQRFTLITVARTWGSSPRPVGAWMALRADGVVQGSVSGGCIEDDLIARMLHGEFNGSEPVVLRYGVSKDEAQRFGLPCGGQLELVLEPAPNQQQLAELADSIAGGRLIKRQLDLTTSAVKLVGSQRGDKPSWDGKLLRTIHGPAWRLLIIGAGQISRYLAQMANMLDYQVFVCDPRIEYRQEWDVDHTTLLSSMPDDAATELVLDPHTAVVALTHDPKLDDLVLLEALKSPAFYVGALGSRINHQHRQARLLQHFDLTDEEVHRLHGPVGIHIGSRTPPEIAVSIMAEMIAIRNGVNTAFAKANTEIKQQGLPNVRAPVCG